MESVWNTFGFKINRTKTLMLAQPGPHIDIKRWLQACFLDSRLQVEVLQRQGKGGVAEKDKPAEKDKQVHAEVFSCLLDASVQSCTFCANPASIATKMRLKLLPWGDDMPDKCTLHGAI